MSKLANGKSASACNLAPIESEVFVDEGVIREFENEQISKLDECFNWKSKDMWQILFLKHVIAFEKYLALCRSLCAQCLPLGGE
jgi:hypothetical protein